MTLDGSGNLRAYKITSDGGIGEKTSEINTRFTSPIVQRQ